MKKIFEETHGAGTLDGFSGRYNVAISVKGYWDADPGFVLVVYGVLVVTAMPEDAKPQYLPERKVNAFGPPFTSEAAARKRVHQEFLYWKKDVREWVEQNSRGAVRP